MDFFGTVENQWQEAVLRWKDEVAKFQAALEMHWANRGKAEELGPDELARWQAQLDYALRVKTAVEMLQEAMANTSSWARSVFGLSGIKGMAAHLGAIPLIPVAVIVGSISTVTAVVYALYSYNSELERKWAYIAAHPGMTPGDVETILESESPIPLLGNVQSMITWIVVGGVILFFGPQLLKRFEK